MTPAPRALPLVAVAGAHVLLGWALLQVSPLRAAFTETLPVIVSLIPEPRPARPPAPLPLPLPTPAPPQARPAQPPPIVLAEAAPTPAPAPVASARVSAEVIAAAAPPAPPASAPPAPPAPAAPPLIDDVAYARPPAVAYPPLSRRLNETGVALVRVLIDRFGEPAQVSLQQSTGFARLDGAALAAVRGARFRPYTRDGTPAPAHALVPIRFELH